MRLFVAVAVSDEVKGGLAAAQRRLAERMKGADVRWQKLEQSHLTLRFLGEVNERDLPGCRLALTEAARRVEPFSLETGGFGAFPSNGRPSVLWLGVGGEVAALHRLQALVASGLEHLGDARSEETFRPHLTLGRVRRLDAAARAEFAGLVAADRPEPVSWRVDSVRLVASDLSPRGARHRELLVVPLAG